jgi:acyl-CoA synthetase (AMP-forming)/AMP-acid ligase II
MSTIADAIWTKDHNTASDESTCCTIILTHPDRDHRRHHHHHHAEEEVYELTYAGARRTCQDHRDRLRQILSTTTTTTTQSTSPAAATAGVQTATPRSVFYLSNNNVDFFLSVLACHYDTDTDQRHSNRFLPVLLSSRWTVTEIVQAIQQHPRLEDDISASYILYYGDGLEQVAKQVVVVLTTCKKEGQRTIACRPIPNYSMKYWRRGELKQLQSLVDRVNDPNQQCKQSSPTPDAESPSLLSQDDAIIVYTSGTSGTPKGVRLSHRAILIQCRTKCQLLQYDTQTHVFANLPPFFHVGGLSSMFAVWMARGILVLFRHSPSRSTHHNDNHTSIHASSWMLRQSLPWVNTLVVVPAMIHMLQQTYNNNNNSWQSCAQPRFPHMRLILIGGQSASPLQLEFVRSMFPRTRIVQTYACTEAASSLTFLDVTTTSATEPPQKQSGQDGSFSLLRPAATTTITGYCVGFPPSHIEMAICQMNGDPDGSGQDDDDEIIQKPFVHGILATRGPHMMNGYWDQTPNAAVEESTKWTRTWFRTNDIGFHDRHGRWYLVGRVTDSIRTGGETVHATEVETILLQHPDIAEAAVFGIPDDRLGELVCCALIPSTWTMTTTTNEHNQQQATSALASLSLENIRFWCTKHGLARYKHPRRILYLNSLPRNTSGKVVKARLAEHFQPKQSKL